MCSRDFHIVGYAGCSDKTTDSSVPCLTQIVGTRASGHSLDVDIPEIWWEVVASYVPGWEGLCHQVLVDAELYDMFQRCRLHQNNRPEVQDLLEW